MLNSRSRLGGSRLTIDSAEPELNMAPLIDMIFILLIFFLVTASFVRQSGVEIDRPQAASAMPTDAAAMSLGLTQTGDLFIEGRPTDLPAVRGRVELFLMETPGGAVMIEADQACPTGRLIAVMDQCRLAGAENIAVSASRISP